MNKKLMATIATSVMTIAANSPAIADMNWGLSPYVGLDAGLRHMEFKKNYGARVAPKNYPQGNVFLGARFCDYLGVELGYESTLSKDRRAVLLGSEIDFVTPIDNAEPNLSNVTDTRVRIHGPHINLVGYLPLSEDCCLQLFGSVGIAELHIKVAYNLPIFRGASNPNFDADHLDFGKRKLIPRATVGIQHLINPCIGVRAFVGWENTSRFKDIRVVNQTSTNSSIARVQDSVNLGIGIFYNF